MSKRMVKKYFKRVSEAQAAGREVPFFYLSKTRRIISDFIDNQYVTVFRPWWYDQFDNWSDYNLSDEMKRHYTDVICKVEQQWSVDIKQIGDGYKALKRVQVRKQRKAKPDPPVRKLRNPETFFITDMQKGKVEVTGEVVFTRRGYKFFIRLVEGAWGREWWVSDVACGMRISKSQRYKQAVKKAQEIIDQSFERYINTVKLKEEEQS
ncbi:hypothetical protein [Paenibacillus sp. M2]|uniref:hypothetical protein n=1 Tax=Paenibacillus sp. M2 TaxID=3341793 RepID=UPI003989E3E8